MQDQGAASYHFGARLQQVYSDVHTWLDETESKCWGNFKKRRLGDKDLGSDPRAVANQFHVLFPAHHFKVVHALLEVIGIETLARQITGGQLVCVLDIGCGAGAASCAFLDAFLSLRERESLNADTKFLFLGVDSSTPALILYDRVMKGYESLLAATDLNVRHGTVNEAVPSQAVYRSLKQRLEQARDEDLVPSLPLVYIAQVNIVRPFRSGFEERKSLRNDLLALGIPDADLDAGSTEVYGYKEVLTYRELMDTLPIDRFHILNIASDENPDWQSLLEQMGNAIERIFPKLPRHKRISGKHTVTFSNPESCNWPAGEERKTSYHLDFLTIDGGSLVNDTHWQGIVDHVNLELAWSRVRLALARETLYDEIEVRLFERDLARNLNRLQRQLMAYVRDIFREGDRLNYEVPKSESETRPKLLSPMEEEILAVAVVQKLGVDFSAQSHRSYAYRLNRGQHGQTEGTEYLYDYWFNAYREFTTATHKCAEEHPDGRIIRIDVQSFYTRIIQAKLVDLARENLRVESCRIKWLLHNLLVHDIGSPIHPPPQGISQGGICSGFFANIYMHPVDTEFGANNCWKVDLFRFVDDIILVVPNPDDEESVFNQAVSCLKELDLDLNQAKTARMSVREYLQELDHDSVLDRLADRFAEIENPLWIANAHYRHRFIEVLDDDDLWWKHLDLYQGYLSAIGFHIDLPRMSRKIWQYLRNAKKRQNDLGHGQELALPSRFSVLAPRSRHEWASEFRRQNKKWVATRHALCQELIELTRQSLKRLWSSNELPLSEEKRLTARIRFAIYRLGRLGLGAIRTEILRVFEERPWLLSQPQYVLDSLVQQGHPQDVLEIADHYRRIERPDAEYLRAISWRALRLLGEPKPEYLSDVLHVAINPEASVVERLTATETCLTLLPRFAEDTVRSLRADTAHSLYQAPDLCRLKKNDILLRGYLGLVDGLRPDSNEDPIIQSAWAIVESGAVEELVLAPEPKLIRDNYYSGDYPDAYDEPSGIYL